MGMTLEVLICTYGNDGIDRVANMNLPQVDNVKYLISWQTEGFDFLTPNELHRKDIKIVTSRQKGLSNNRNHAIEKASGDICLIADDDLIYTHDQLKAIIHTFENNPNIDFALFKYSGGDLKSYPSYEFDLKKEPKGYYITSFEIAFRRTSVDSSLRFDSRLGVGTSMPAGEEAIFIYQALKKGLNCRFFPITITHHAELTTGSRTPTPGVLQANGVVVAVKYGLLGLLRLPIIAWRHHKQGEENFFPAVHNLLKGYIYGKKNF